MTTITQDVKVTTSVNYDNAISGKFAANLQFRFADTTYYNSTLSASNLELGTDDAPTKFLTLQDAVSYFFPTKASTLVTNANALYAGSGTDFAYGNMVLVDSPIQPVNGNLTQVSGISGPLSADMISLLGMPNIAAVKTAMSLATVATSGAYSDLSGKPTIPSVTRTTSTQSMSLVGTGATGTQISSTKDSTVRFTVSTSTTSTIGGPATSLVALKICATNDSTEGNWTTVSTFESDQTVTLAIALQCIQVVKGQVTADVPAGWYCKLVNSGTGTHSEAFVSGQKTIYG